MTSVVSAGSTWRYASSDGGGQRTVRVSDPANVTTTYVFDLASQRMRSMTDGLNRTTRWDYDGSRRLQSATAPEGNSVTYAYDGRGNVTSSVFRSKDGGATITTRAYYDATCGNALTCNQPNSTVDANGNVTDYAYDPTHGGVVAVTAPAGANGVRPKVTYGYGSYGDQFGGTVWKRTWSKACRTAGPDVCEGGADQVVTTTDYGSLSGNNLLPVSVTRRSGDNSVSSTTRLGYDAFGDVTSTTAPVGR